MKPNDRRYTLPSTLALCLEFAEVEAFDLDAAAEIGHHCAPVFYDGDTRGDGLREPWFGHVFVNCPWSELERWVERCWWQIENESVKSITMLVPGNRQEQGWWQQHVEPFRDGPVTNQVRLSTTRGVLLRTRYPSGRQRYGNTDNTEPGSPSFNSVILNWRVA